MGSSFRWSSDQQLVWRACHKCEQAKRRDTCQGLITHPSHFLTSLDLVLTTAVGHESDWHHFFWRIKKDSEKGNTIPRITELGSGSDGGNSLKYSFKRFPNVQGKELHTLCDMLALW